ncbi:MAG TPA: carboxymuconolactone decarboxylase family protein [Steroidobacteraceae bacterium]|nr:carboxymuconolactone decarboxylase family protein [Steroidobacteraceae bacterium]
MQHDAQYQTGLNPLERLHGGQAGEQLVCSLREICPDFATMTIEWALGGIMRRPGLDLLTREFLLIASCVTLGHAMPQLQAHIEAALKLGATKEQIVEMILQMLFYAGGAATAMHCAAHRRCLKTGINEAHAPGGFATLAVPFRLVQTAKLACGRVTRGILPLGASPRPACAVR